MGGGSSATLDVGARHQGNLDVLLATPFSDPNTDIPAFLESIDDAAASANVPPPTDIWINKLNLQHLRNSNSFKVWARNNQQAAALVLQGHLTENLWGRTWHFLGTKYQAADGSMKPYIPLTGQGSLVLTPPPGEAWVKASQGSSLVPRSLNIGSDVDEILNNFDVVYGPFAYAKLLDDPVRLLGYIGDKFGFNFNEPNAIWQAAGF